VAAAGDTDGDGFDDLLVGAYGAGSGRASLYDCNRYAIVSPSAEALWNVGAREEIAWLGAQPADVWLSVDGGDGYSLVRSGVGGAASNRVVLTVPHRPTRFAKVRVTPSDIRVGGQAESGSLFTIDAAIALLLLRAAPAPENDRGVIVSWSTDPGPDELSGYRLEKSTGAGSGHWQPAVPFTVQTSYHDADGTAASRYRLTGINRLGGTLLLGETSVRSRQPLTARPHPFRTGEMAISFATAGGLGGGLGEAELALFDVSGRLVRRLARGTYPPGHQEVRWDGRDEMGRSVTDGLYFLRAVSGGELTTLKVTVLR
jgi:hypothetical protein